MKRLANDDVRWNSGEVHDKWDDLGKIRTVGTLLLHQIKH